MPEREPKPPRMPKGNGVRMHGKVPKAGHQAPESLAARQARLRALREGKKRGD